MLEQVKWRLIVWYWINYIYGDKTKYFNITLEDEINVESLKDAGNDLDMEVLLRITLLCIVSNNSYTKV